MYDNEDRSLWKSPVAAIAVLCAAALLLLALKVLIADPRVRTEIAAAKQARERKQIQRYEAKRFEEQEQIDEDVHEECPALSPLIAGAYRHGHALCAVDVL